MATIYAKLAAAQAAMDNPTKSETATVPTKSGGKYTYRYETLAEVLGIIKPALHASGLALIQGTRLVEGRTIMETGVGDAETGEALVLDSIPMMLPADPQAAGSAITYARRYGLKTAFGLAGEDDDGAQAALAASAPRSRPSTTPNPSATKTPVTEDHRALFGTLVKQARTLGLDEDSLKGAGLYLTTKFDGRPRDKWTDAEYAEGCAYLRGIIEELERGRS